MCRSNAQDLLAGHMKRPLSGLVIPVDSFNHKVRIFALLIWPSPLSGFDYDPSLQGLVL